MGFNIELIHAGSLTENSSIIVILQPRQHPNTLTD